LQYSAPKLEQRTYNFQSLTLPDNRQYWGLGWTVEINKPEPQPDYHTGPHGRLKWISPICMGWHHISPPDEDRCSKLYRLCKKKGWHGMSVYRVSAYEETRIKAFLKTLERKNYIKERSYINSCTDERAGDIGDHDQKHLSFYFSSKALWEQFADMLAAIPKRTQEMYVDHRQITKACTLALRGLNWHVFRGEDADLFTVEESVDSVVLMMMRLAAGVGKPPGESEWRTPG
jgi:hypothetical protein